MFVINLDFLLENNYLFALKNKFLEYIIFQHTIPIGKVLFDKIILFISQLINLEIKFIYYFFNVFTSYIFFYFIILYINISYKNDKKLKYSLLFLTILISAFFDNYEVWRLNYHDHLNFFLIACFSLIILIKNEFHKNYKIYYILLLILISYTLGIVFFSAYIILISIYKFLNSEKLKNELITITFFSIIFLIICMKNYISVKIFSPSTTGGANLIQRTLHSIGNENYFNLINNSQDIPMWFKVCNNNIFKKYKKLKFKDLDNFQSKLAHGLCYENDDKKIGLKKYKDSVLKVKKDNNFINAINQDIDLLEKKQWMFSGEHNEVSYKISSYYLSFGGKIFKEAIIKYPKEMLFGKIGKKGIVLTSLQMVSYGGLLPEYYENFSYPKRNIFFSLFYKFLSFILIIILLLTPLVVLKKIKNSISKKKVNYKDFIYFLFLTIVSFQIILTSVLTCCENPRIAVIYFPMILIIVLLNIENFVKRKI